QGSLGSRRSWLPRCTLRSARTRAPSLSDRTASAAVDVGFVAVPDAIRARAGRALACDADPARAVRRRSASDAVRAHGRAGAAAVDPGLAAVANAVATGRLLAGDRPRSAPRRRRARTGLIGL